MRRFGLNFRTVPDNNRGAMHVVDQSLLSGSKNYPIRNPFNQLQRGSLQTYIDSWTHKDRTAFVVASRNKTDFRHSFKVYLDAVFHPLFVQDDQKWIFRQEGWRLEVSDNKDIWLSGYVILG